MLLGSDTCYCDILSVAKAKGNDMGNDMGDMGNDIGDIGDMGDDMGTHFFLCSPTQSPGGKAECDRSTVDLSCHFKLVGQHYSPGSSLPALPERNSGFCHPSWRDSRSEGLLGNNKS